MQAIYDDIMTQPPPRLFFFFRGFRVEVATDELIKSGVLAFAVCVLIILSYLFWLQNRNVTLIQSENIRRL